MKPARPNLLVFASVRELYLHFERIFLSGAATTHQITSSCGHTIMVFDHHFFHLVKLDDPTKPKPLKMASEKARILATANGFGPYVHDKQRAIYLESAMACLICPDEVWEDHTLTSAKWIYLKEFDAKPYSWTIALVSERPDGRVPNTSFPAKERDARKWRRGSQIFP